jgi:hypothetical protein
MRSHILPFFALAGLVLAGWNPARAQERDWPRAHRIVERALDNLHHIEHREGWITGDRGHFDAAEHNLADIRKDLDRNRLDRGRLEDAIREVEYITHVDRLDGHARERLNEDLRELRHLRDEWHWR